MQDWTAGYVADLEYSAGFYRELAPAWINFAALLAGHQPVDISQPFAYCELGCGRGVSSNLFAAANPLGEFHAVDFNPAHIQDARQLAKEAGLSNISFYEKSFEELLAMPDSALPEFDFITLHGVYTWVSAENRAHIVEFIRRRLKSGGMVYVSYNAQPGWAAATPVQRLLYEHASLHSGRSDKRMGDAASFMERLRGSGARFFTANTNLKGRLDRIKESSANYLAHEYLNADWHILYHSDVVKEMHAAKLSYLCSANYLDAYPQLIMTTEQIAVLNEINDPAFRETLRDFMLNTQFRKDIFVRGGRRLEGRSLLDAIGGITLALVIPRENVKLEIKSDFGEISANADIYIPVFDALASGPKTMDELARCLTTPRNRADMMQIVATVATSAQGLPVYPVPDRRAARQFNRAVARQSQDTDQLHILASSVLANGMACTMTELLALDGIFDGVPVDPAALAQHALASLKIRNQRLIRNGVELQRDEENLNYLRELMASLIANNYPTWQLLGVI